MLVRRSGVVFGAPTRTVVHVVTWRRGRRKPKRASAEISVELDALFGPSRKHVHERKEWVAVAKVDDHESGAGPIDLDSGVVQVRFDTDQPAEPSSEAC